MKNEVSYAKLFIDNEELVYKIRMSERAKYLRIQISNGNELELIVPRGCALKEAEKFLHRKIGWIKKHMAEQISKDAGFFYLGNELKIIREYELFSKNHRVLLEDNKLKIISPSGSDVKENVIYENWLKNTAKDYLVKRARELSVRLNIVINNITIRGQKTRWGSCSSRGNLSFNYKLMRYKKEVVDYVIIHELCHRKEMNHSKKFWILVSKYCPDYKILKKELRGGIY